MCSCSSQAGCISCCHCRVTWTMNLNNKLYTEAYPMQPVWHAAFHRFTLWILFASVWCSSLTRVSRGPDDSNNISETSTGQWHFDTGLAQEKNTVCVLIASIVKPRSLVLMFGWSVYECEGGWTGRVCDKNWKPARKTSISNNFRAAKN